MVCISPRSEEDWHSMVMRRNTGVRNYTPEQAMADFSITSTAYAQHVKPSVRYADVAVLVDTDYKYDFR